MSDVSLKKNEYEQKACFCMIIFFVTIFHSLQTQASPSLFKSIETPYSDLSRIQKWTDMLNRYSEEVQEKQPCATRNYDSCKYPEWEIFIKDTLALPPMMQLPVVNRHMNKIPYVADSVNWGVQDYWETPGQFLSRGGDCMSYAIIKYMTLRLLGWPAERMRIVIVQDLDSHLVHAVLAVYVGNRIFILDNRTNAILDSERIQHYLPIFSLNEKLWWHHTTTKQIAGK